MPALKETSPMAAKKTGIAKKRAVTGRKGGLAKKKAGTSPKLGRAKVGAANKRGAGWKKGSTEKGSNFSST
jgi:hypothetical protein